MYNVYIYIYYIYIYIYSCMILVLVLCQRPSPREAWAGIVPATYPHTSEMPFASGGDISYCILKLPLGLD